MLATADVAVAVIEPDAAAFSVPSKVQSYLCAGRAVLLAAPAANLASRVVRAQGAGVVVEPEDRAGFVRGGVGLMATRPGGGRWVRGGGPMRSGPIDVERVADRFEEVLAAARAPEAGGVTARALMLQLFVLIYFQRLAIPRGRGWRSACRWSRPGWRCWRWRPRGG